MFSFKHLINKVINTLPTVKDQIIFDGSSEYLYFDIQEGNEIVRHKVHAAGISTEIAFDNSVDGLLSTNVQDAIDEILQLVRQSAPEIIINVETGELSYDATGMTLEVNSTTVDLEYESGIYNLQIDSNGDLRYEIN